MAERRYLARFAELKRRAEARSGTYFPIIVIQEAGLDGFWIHRVLEAEGIERYVVDPASIATSRRRRRAKTDKIDGEALVRALLAYKRGEPRVCAMLRVPTPEEEDRRRIARERKALTNERTRHINRLKGLLFALKTGDGRPLPVHLKRQIGRELDRLELLIDQIKAVEVERDAMLAAEQAVSPAPAMLLALGIGPEFTAVLWSEGLSRHYDNRRQLAAYAGLAATPWKSGAIDHEQGVSKSGNPKLRTTLVQMAWLWVRISRARRSPMVQGAGEAEQRPAEEDDDRGDRPQAARGAVEIRQRRRCHRGSDHDSCLMRHTHRILPSSRT